jgi:hypothetical protein
MFSKDNLKRLAEQAQKAGNRLATNAGGTTNQWFAGQGSPERNTGATEIHSLGPDTVKLRSENIASVQGMFLRGYQSCHLSRL